MKYSRVAGQAVRFATDANRSGPTQREATQLRPECGVVHFVCRIDRPVGAVSLCRAVRRAKTTATNIFAFRGAEQIRYSYGNLNSAARLREPHMYIRVASEDPPRCVAA